MKTNTKKNTPELRFPEFDGEWNLYKLKEISKIERGRFTPRPRNNPIYYNGDIPFVQTSDVVNSNGIISHYSQTLNENGLKVSKLFEKGTILITIAANIGYTGVLDIDMACPDSLVGIICNDGFDNFFLNYLLSIEQERMDRLASAAAQKNINIQFLKPYKLILPKLPEQQKIANFLSQVDQKIDLLSQKVEQLALYKKGVMQKIFSQEIRFKQDDGNDFPDWEERKFKDILHEHKLKSTGKEIVHSVSVHKGVINQIEHLGRSFAAKNTDNYNRVLPNDIIYTKSPTGDFPLGIIKQSHLDKEVIVSPLYGVFTPETKDLGYILHVYFESNINTSNYLSSIIQKGAKNTINITNTTFLSKKMFLPVSKKEQNKIANFLSAIDRKIESAQHQLEQTQEFKKGLLQKMFV